MPSGCRRSGGALSAVLAVSLAACKGTTPVAPPPVVTNTPPTIQTVSIAGTRAEAGQPIQVTAAVSDVETPLDQLTYTWSASPSNGTFSGSGATRMWTPPSGQSTPAVYTVTLTVTESYTSAGQMQQNTVSRSTTVRYNDSPAETTALGLLFIKDFGTFEVSPEQCVRNFSDNCRGKQAELEDIQDNRLEVTIQSSQFTPTIVTFNGDMTEGVVEGPCVFEDIPNFGANAGKRQRVSGTCHLTTVYENFRWYLCDSFFRPPYNTITLQLKGRVPGRILFD